MLEFDNNESDKQGTRPSATGSVFNPTFLDQYRMEQREKKEKNAHKNLVASLNSFSESAERLSKTKRGGTKTDSGSIASVENVRSLYKSVNTLTKSMEKTNLSLTKLLTIMTEDSTEKYVEEQKARRQKIQDDKRNIKKDKTLEKMLQTFETLEDNDQERFELEKLSSKSKRARKDLPQRDMDDALKRQEILTKSFTSSIGNAIKQLEQAIIFTAKQTAKPPVWTMKKGYNAIAETQHAQYFQENLQETKKAGMHQAINMLFGGPVLGELAVGAGTTVARGAQRAYSSLKGKYNEWKDKRESKKIIDTDFFHTGGRVVVKRNKGPARDLQKNEVVAVLKEGERVLPASNDKRNLDQIPILKTSDAVRLGISYKKINLAPAISANLPITLVTKRSFFNEFGKTLENINFSGKFEDVVKPLDSIAKDTSGLLSRLKFDRTKPGFIQDVLGEKGLLGGGYLRKLFKKKEPKPYDAIMYESVKKAIKDSGGLGGPGGPGGKKKSLKEKMLTAGPAASYYYHRRQKSKEKKKEKKLQELMYGEKGSKSLLGILGTNFKKNIKTLYEDYFGIPTTRMMQGGGAGFGMMGGMIGGSGGGGRGKSLFENKSKEFMEKERDKYRDKYKKDLDQITNKINITGKKEAEKGMNAQARQKNLVMIAGQEFRTDRKNLRDSYTTGLSDREQKIKSKDVDISNVFTQFKNIDNLKTKLESKKADRENFNSFKSYHDKILQTLETQASSVNSKIYDIQNKKQQKTNKELILEEINNKEATLSLLVKQEKEKEQKLVELREKRKRRIELVSEQAELQKKLNNPDIDSTMREGFIENLRDVLNELNQLGGINLRPQIESLERELIDVQNTKQQTKKEYFDIRKKHGITGKGSKQSLIKKIKDERELLDQQEEQLWKQKEKLEEQYQKVQSNIIKSKEDLDRKVKEAEEDIEKERQRIWDEIERIKQEKKDAEDEREEFIRQKEEEHANQKKQFKEKIELAKKEYEESIKDLSKETTELTLKRKNLIEDHEKRKKEAGEKIKKHAIKLAKDDAIEGATSSFGDLQFLVETHDQQYNDNISSEVLDLYEKTFNDLINNPRKLRKALKEKVKPKDGVITKVFGKPLRRDKYSVEDYRKRRSGIFSGAGGGVGGVGGAGGIGSDKTISDRLLAIAQINQDMSKKLGTLEKHSWIGQVRQKKENREGIWSKLKGSKEKEKMKWSDFLSGSSLLKLVAGFGLPLMIAGLRGGDMGGAGKGTLIGALVGAMLGLPGGPGGILLGTSVGAFLGGMLGASKFRGVDKEGNDIFDRTYAYFGKYKTGTLYGALIGGSLGLMFGPLGFAFGLPAGAYLGSLLQKKHDEIKAAGNGQEQWYDKYLKAFKFGNMGMKSLYGAGIGGILGLLLMGPTGGLFGAIAGSFLGGVVDQYKSGDVGLLMDQLKKINLGAVPAGIGIGALGGFLLGGPIGAVAFAALGGGLAHWLKKSERFDLGQYVTDIKNKAFKWPKAYAAYAAVGGLGGLLLGGPPLAIAGAGLGLMFGEKLRSPGNVENDIKNILNFKESLPAMKGGAIVGSIAGLILGAGNPLLIGLGASFGAYLAGRSNPDTSEHGIMSALGTIPGLVKENAGTIGKFSLAGAGIGTILGLIYLTKVIGPFKAMQAGAWLGGLAGAGVGIGVVKFEEYFPESVTSLAGGAAIGAAIGGILLGPTFVGIPAGIGIGALLGGIVGGGVDALIRKGTNTLDKRFGWNTSDSVDQITESMWGGGLGAVLGFLLMGPPGAYIGAAIGAVAVPVIRQAIRKHKREKADARKDELNRELLKGQDQGKETVVLKELTLLDQKHGTNLAQKYTEAKQDKATRLATEDMIRERIEQEELSAYREAYNAKGISKPYAIYLQEYSNQKEKLDKELTAKYLVKTVDQ